MATPSPISSPSKQMKDIYKVLQVTPRSLLKIKDLV